MLRCSSCEFDNSAAARFCSGCGRPLQVQSPSERRQLTVMFCDLVGSTALSQALDPEDLSELIHAYQHTVTDVVDRYDGHVAQYLGDGMLIYFGFPSAHEDDPRRAAHAGLSILDNMRALNARLGGAIQLPVRISIHTGSVVVGAVGTGATQEQLALGSTPNIAAKLQELALPDTIVVSDTTRQLLGRAFILETIAQGLVDKKIAGAIRASRLLGRANSPVISPTSVIVGRARELQGLWAAYEATAADVSTVVLLSGEAGIGKSRLIYELQRRAELNGDECWITQCSPYEQERALSSVAALLRTLLEIDTRQSSAEHLLRLEAALSAQASNRNETRALLAGFLAIPLRDGPPLDVSPQKRKALIFDAVAAMLMDKARGRHAAWVIEDLHWADPSTLEFVGFLMALRKPLPLLLVMTARPSFESPWHSGVENLRLVALSRDETRDVVASVCGQNQLPLHWVDQIVDRADGVPLFVEELAKTALDAAEAALPSDSVTDAILQPLVVPTSLQDSLTARIDRTGTAKEIAQLGAVLGRDFTVEMLQALSPMGHDKLNEALAHLLETNLIFEQEAGKRYSFKHALVRDAAYGMLLRSVRRKHHRAVGETLRDTFPQTADTHPELVAHHFTEAEAFELASPYWLAAGRRATQESANVEAIRHLKRALKSLAEVHESPQRDQLELAALLALGPPLELAEGYVVDEVQRIYLRAQELNERVGDVRNRFWINFALCQFRGIRGEIAEGQEIARQTLALAQSIGDPFFLARAYGLLGGFACYAGDFASATDLLAQALEKLPGQDHEFVIIAGMDMGAFINLYAAWAAWHRGHSDQARQHIAAALASAEASGRANARGHALTLGATIVSHFLQDVGAVAAYAREAIALSEKHGFATWTPQLGIFVAWAQAAEGNVEQRQTAGQESLALLNIYRASGAGLTLTYYTAVVAEIQAFCGNMAQAESLIDEAIALHAKRPDPMWAAEVLRLKGTFVECRAKDEAQAYFARAIALARSQGSRAQLERAEKSLAQSIQASQLARQTDR